MASDGGDGSTGEPHSVFQTRRLLQVIELPLENSDETNVILAFASRCAAKKQFQAFYCADKTLLLRSLEEDLHPRYWRLPWAMALERLQPTSKLPTTTDGSSTTPLQQQHHVVGLEFAPEGDWLAVIVSSGLRTFLLLVPVASLVTRERKVSLEMLSFLRPHGQNGAKYNSAVTGDSEDMSVLEFAQGMSSPTCVTWWRSFNGRNYVLLGSSSDLISIVHVETNVECCRCELSGDDDDDRDQDDVETQVVHTLKLREDEWVRHAQLGHTSSKDQPSTIAYFVYECRPKWTSSTLFHALYTRTMHVQHAVFIGYALGLDMAALW
ncbi:hypothetical protein DYB30_004935 [Aphanomyces astaci]|uniref:Uncharacterized protein n=3 Tax=Aphanomyces astaci TaxID=112090 RepID=A0A397CHM4_APHAT|nr:hypothetical protein DYB38_004719 [Aphanomyces astaci]RHY59120.1 hypothetical protein DYB34_002968 [Aphanomyces astaci]RHY60298.1 hypothetical protein DYB30_004935 [Aphanomyces astaci]